jgi:hypothetical protein
MLWQDSPLWHPLTAPDLGALPAWRRALLRLAHATPLRFLERGLRGWAASWDGLDLRRHPPAARPWVVLSWAVPAGFAALVLPALLAGGGLERLVGWWLAPWLVFNAWQGLVAVAERTAPHIPFVEEVGWERGRWPGKGPPARRRAKTAGTACGGGSALTKHGAACACHSNTTPTPATQSQIIIPLGPGPFPARLPQPVLTTHKTDSSGPPD